MSCEYLKMYDNLPKEEAIKKLTHSIEVIDMYLSVFTEAEERDCIDNGKKGMLWHVYQLREAKKRETELLKKFEGK